MVVSRPMDRGADVEIVEQISMSGGRVSRADAETKTALARRAVGSSDAEGGVGASARRLSDRRSSWR